MESNIFLLEAMCEIIIYAWPVYPWPVTHSDGKVGWVIQQYIITVGDKIKFTLGFFLNYCNFG